MNPSAFLEEKGQSTEAALRRLLENYPGVPERLREAMAYSLFAGGKRLRPALVLGAAELLGASTDSALPAACAIEMIHTYSLIHDDLPCMDDDDLRRGRPTLHKVYGEAMAVLAGDALLTLAFEELARTGRADLVSELAQAAGAAGMVGGQVIDMLSEGEQIPLDALRHLHACKTGALIRGAVRLGALAANAAPARLDALTRYGEAIGLAFQIADDILDVVGSEKDLGKRVGADAAHDKSTYPALLGLEESRRLGNDAVAAALEALSSFGSEAEPFRLLACYIMERNK